MRGIEAPERSEDFTADPVELFFDLAYVFAFSQLVGRLVDDATWAGVGEATLLFALMWLPWSQVTWSANAVSGNGRVVRSYFLVATAASVPMAASVSTAYGPGGPVFALSLAVIFVIGAATMALGVERRSAVSSAIAGWVRPNLVAIVLLVVGAYLNRPARGALWSAALVVIVVAMYRAGGGEWIVRSGHFAERHGLIIIVALGEAIVALGVPVVASLEEGGGMEATTVAALVASAVFVALLWWAYFDRVGPALEHRGATIEGDRERGRYVRDVYSWAHAPIAAGIVLAAAALETVALDPLARVSVNIRLMLFGGLALGVLGVSGAIWRAFGVVTWERVVVLVAIGVLLGVASPWAGIAVILAVDTAIAVSLVVEHLRIEH